MNNEQIIKIMTNIREFRDDLEFKACAYRFASTLVSGEASLLCKANYRVLRKTFFDLDKLVSEVEVFFHEYSNPLQNTDDQPNSLFTTLENVTTAAPTTTHKNRKKASPTLYPKDDLRNCSDQDPKAVMPSGVIARSSGPARKPIADSEEPSLSDTRPERSSSFATRVSGHFKSLISKTSPLLTRSRRSTYVFNVIFDRLLCILSGALVVLIFRWLSHV